MKRCVLYLIIFAIPIGLLAQERSLDYYITQGISASPLLKDYSNQILTNMQDSLFAKVLQKPVFSANGQMMVAPYNSYFGYDEAISNGANYIAVAGVSQSIFMNKKLSNKYKNLALQNNSLQNESKITEQELKKLITEQYITAYSSGSEIKYTKEIIDLLAEEDQLLKQLADKGLYKQSEYLSFVIEEQTQHTSLLEMQIQYKQDLYDLNFLCGITDTATYILSNPKITATSLISYENTPAYQKFKIDSLISINDKEAVELEYKPSVDWFADAGVMSTEIPSMYKHFGFSVGFNFSVPIGKRKLKSLELQKIKIEEDSRMNYQSFFKNQYSVKQIQLAEKIQSYAQLEAQVNKQLGSIEELLKMNRLQLNTGELSISDHILTIKNYIDTKYQLNQYELEKMKMINDWNNISF